MRLQGVIVFLFLSSVSLVSCKIYGRCELAKDLLDKYGVPWDQLGDWVCIAQWESSFNTDAINKYNTDGSWDYGIFQINSYYWCQGENTHYNGCNVNCDALLSSNLYDSVKCGEQIRGEQGFSAWVNWRNHCQGQDLSGYTAGCNL